MDRTVVTVIVVVVILLGLPLLANMKGGAGGGSGTQGGAPAKPIALEPPYWNSSNLAGTQWSGTFSGIDATLTLQPGGTALAVSSNMLVRTMVPSGQLQGTWSVEGNKFTLEAEVPKMGKKKITGLISGKQIIDEKGQPLPIQQIR